MCIASLREGSGFCCGNLRSARELCSGADKTYRCARCVAIGVGRGIVRRKGDSSDAEFTRDTRQRVFDIAQRESAANREMIRRCDRNVENVEIEMNIDLFHVLADGLERSR